MELTAHMRLIYHLIFEKMARKLSLNQLCAGKHNSNVVLASFRHYAESGASIADDVAIMAIKRQGDNLTDENLAELRRVLLLGAMSHGLRTCYVGDTGMRGRLAAAQNIGRLLFERARTLGGGDDDRPTAVGH